MGIHGYHSYNLAGPKANAESNHPQETVTDGGRAQRQAPPRARGIAAHDGESRDPIDHRLRTRGLRDATPLSEELEHARHGPTADPSFAKAS